MNEQTKHFAEGLRTAILAEIEGQHFYRMAATNTQDEQGKQIFTQLAEEEVQHEQWLRQHYESLVATGEIDQAVKIAGIPDLANDSPIFSAKIKTRLGEAHYEMTALAVGVQLELGAEQFYKKLADEAAAAGQEDLASFFQDLAQWESKHYHALLRQQEELRTDYWAEAGFTAF